MPISGTIAAVGSIGGAVIGAVGSTSAASTQAQAAQTAAEIQATEAQNALNFQEQMFGTEEGALQPYLASGNAALANLDYLLGIGSPSTTAPTAGVSSTAAAATAPVVSPPAGSPTATTPTTSPTARFPVTPAGSPLALKSSTNVPLSTLTQVTPTSATAAPVAATPTAATSAPGSPLPVTPGTPTNVNGYSVPGTGTVANPPTTSQELTSLSSLVNPSIGTFGELAQPWTQTFQAPTAAQAAATPGYQFELGQGEQAIQNSAAASGGLLSTGTAKALDQYSQGLASTNYQQAYNNALTNYQTAYNTFEQNQANLYNRLASVSGLGQVSTQQLGGAASGAANSATNALLTAGSQIGSNVNTAGGATASGYVGAANALTGGLSSLSELALLQQLSGGAGGSSGTGYNYGGSTAAGSTSDYLNSIFGGSS